MVQCILTAGLLMYVSYFRSAAKERLPIVWELKLYQETMGGCGADVNTAHGDDYSKCMAPSAEVCHAAAAL
jgi:hypothetical protein